MRFFKSTEDGCWKLGQIEKANGSVYEIEFLEGSTETATDDTVYIKRAGTDDVVAFGHPTSFTDEEGNGYPDWATLFSAVKSFFVSASGSGEAEQATLTVVGGVAEIDLSTTKKYAPYTASGNFEIQVVNPVFPNTAVLPLYPNGHTVTIETRDDLVNKGSINDISATELNDILFGTTEVTDMYAIVRQSTYTDPKLPVPTVTLTSATVDTLTFGISTNVNSLGTEVRISTDGVTYGIWSNIGVNTTSYAISGLTVGQTRYLQARFIGNGTTVITSDPSTAVSGTTAEAPVYKSVVFDNNAAKSLTFPADANLNYGNGTTADAPSFYSARVKITEDLALNNILFRGNGQGSIGVVLAMANLKPIFNLYEGTQENNLISAIANSDLLLDTWYTLTVTYDGSGSQNGLKLYVNGVLTATTNTLYGTYTATEQSGNFKIGKFIGLTESSASNLLSDICIGGKELSALEALELHNLNESNPSTLSFASDIDFYNRLNGDLTCEIGSYILTNNGGVGYSTDGAY